METIAAGVDTFGASHRELEVVPHAVWDALHSRAFKGGTVSAAFKGRGHGLGGQWTTCCPLCLDQPLDVGHGLRAMQRDGKWLLESEAADERSCQNVGVKAPFAPCSPGTHSRGEAEAELDDLPPLLVTQWQEVLEGSIPDGVGVDGPLVRHSVEVIIYKQVLPSADARPVLQGLPARGKHALFYSPPHKHKDADVDGLNVRVIGGYGEEAERLGEFTLLSATAFGATAGCLHGGRSPTLNPTAHLVRAVQSANARVRSEASGGPAPQNAVHPKKHGRSRSRVD